MQNSPSLTLGEIRARVQAGLPESAFAGRRVLALVPDHTRSAPVGMLFREVFSHLAPVVKQLDIMIALGTHPPMSEAAMLQRMDWTEEERTGRFGSVRLLNHAWNDDAQLTSLGAISSASIRELTGGLFEQEVEVRINRAVRDYDDLLILGPVFPHEVVGFSGGNKYLFPGISGPEVLNFFHWLGAVVTNPEIIGVKRTPVRAVVDEAAALVPNRRWCAAMVVRSDGSLADLAVDTPERAWERAADTSAREHIVRKPHPFHTILSCAPPMYDELWVAGKCMYKLEPVLADGGELIIYAPHLSEVSITHGALIERIGYHCRDYFFKQWDRFKGEPWGVLAHSTHVFGGGRYENGVETPRARVTLASAIPEDVCRRINLGYRAPKSIRLDDYRNREDEGILLVPKAGEYLYRLA